MTWTSTDGRRAWLVLPDPLSTRLFSTCRLVEGLADALDGRLRLVFLEPREQASRWAELPAGVPAFFYDDLFPVQVGAGERVVRKLDAVLEERVGFWPLAIRFNYRHGFHLERMAKGHGNPFLDLAHRDPLPRSRSVERALHRWYFSPHRYVASTLRARMDEECSGVVAVNLQTPNVAAVLAAARRLRLPVAGYVASWDHAVGKGVISPHLDRYVVQNAVMRDDLARYHSVDPDRVVVTGWPQSDYFFRRTPMGAFTALLRRHSLDPALPVVLVMGNTPTNAPFEPRFFERLVSWWAESGGRERFSMLFRPHPRDQRWRERFSAAMGIPGIAVQPAEEADLSSLAVMLQHGSCVVTNAGTVLLDSLTNDRPAVCVLYDEGAPAGESWAAKNVLGVHYRELMGSTAFYRAHSFDEVTASVERALANPRELSAERRRVAREVVGDLDGRAGVRAVAAMAEVVGGAWRSRSR